MIGPKFLRLSSRAVSFNSGRARTARFTSSTPSLLTTSDEDNNLLQQETGLSHLRLKHSVEPIPYTSGVELTPLNTVDDKLGHKKVSVVGCGQVSVCRFLTMGVLHILCRQFSPPLFHRWVWQSLIPCSIKSPQERLPLST